MRIVTARGTFGGELLDDVPVLNPGDWTGRAWLVEVGAAVGPACVVVEADRPADALAALAASPRYAHLCRPCRGRVHGDPAADCPFPCTYHGPGLPPAGVRPTAFWEPAALI